MAERRMFAKSIIDSDAFLEMPLSTQALYFHLSMRADDDGFVNNPKKISRMIGSSEDEMKVLFAKKFILGFESGVIVIKHWKIHNLIQKDRYKSTNYIEEKSQLVVDEVKNYHLGTECIQLVSSLDTECEQSGNAGKVRLGKDSLGKDSEAIASLFEFWKTTLHHEQSRLDSKRRGKIQAALKLGYTEEQLQQAIIGCSKTPYNMGQNERNTVYDDIELILRDAVHIDRFIANASSKQVIAGTPAAFEATARQYKVFDGGRA